MNRYMKRPFRCNICFRSFDTDVVALAHWLAEHTAIAMEAREGEDVQQASSRSDDSAAIAQKGAVNE